MADSSGSSPNRWIIVIALLSVAVLWFWMRAEQRHAAEWREEFQRQRTLADAAKAEAAENRLEAERARVLAAERADEINRMRNFPVQQPQPQELPLPFIAVGIGLRSWGPEQATGAPDTPNGGDHSSAWAPLTQDGQPEWLELEYAESVTVTKVLVHETYNPGALTRVTSVDENGKETEVWTGKDPTPMNVLKGVSEVAAAGTPRTKKIKIYINSPAVPGWNEIDAVGVVDDRGKTHWATKAEASSSYAEQIAPAVQPAPPVEVAPRDF